MDAELAAAEEAAEAAAAAEALEEVLEDDVEAEWEESGWAEGAADAEPFVPAPLAAFRPADIDLRLGDCQLDGSHCFSSDAEDGFQGAVCLALDHGSL